MTGNTCNPKFRTPPVFASPSHDIMSWRESDFVRSHSSINAAPRRRLMQETTLNWPTLLRATEPKAPRDLQTQVLSEPGIYQTALSSQPIISNIGISFAPQFPRQELVVGDGYLDIRDHSRQQQPASQQQQKTPNYSFRPKSILKSTTPNKRVHFSGPETVKDTRYEGPGDSRMMRYNPMFGKWEPSGYKDVVDAVRAPLPIKRSKLDMFDWADDTSLEKINMMAVKQFFDDTDIHRVGIQNHAMRAINEARLQRRQLPIRTF
jgi:hypothetical protein